MTEASAPQRSRAPVLKKKPKKRWGLRILALLLLGLLLAGAAAAWLWKKVEEPLAPATEQVLLIEPGTSAQRILGKLEVAGVIADARLARAVLRYRLSDSPLQAGEYRFVEEATAEEVLQRLVQGDVVEHALTLIEGLDLEETAKTLADQGFGSYEAFLEAAQDPSLIADLDPLATNLEGYLFPDTYRFVSGVSEQKIVETLVAMFRRRWDEAVVPNLENGNPAPPLTRLRDVVTLASIIEKEARLDSERPVISAVYRNRLERGIALYADPTVIYAIKLQGQWDGNIRRRDLAIDSPYNTYRYPGLPPGPIASPGAASLEAAVKAADVEFLYFVSRNDGSHVFARTLAEHNRNVDRWQRQYWRERRASEGSK